MQLKVKILSQKADYNIAIGFNLFSDIWDYLSINYDQHKKILFCDNNIMKIYSDKFISFRKTDSRIEIISFPAGEKSKTTIMKEKLESLIIKKGFDRNTVLIAIGGGITGDLGGFISATYYRGIPFIQVPTSLLAMVDSSIGGKVAVNHPLGKNLIGAFYQPKAVFIDIKTLKTLPQKHLLNGFAEIIKTALISDKSFFELLEKNIDKILQRDISILQNIIFKSCFIKSKIVMKDEKELNVRKILNYGHTIGHAIEKLSNYKLLHGFAISVGMNVENRISMSLGILKQSDFDRVNILLAECNLPTKIPKYLNPKLILNKLKYDKKSVDNVKYFSLLSNIGNCKYNLKVDDKLILESIKQSFE